MRKKFMLSMEQRRSIRDNILQTTMHTTREPERLKDIEAEELQIDQEIYQIMGGEDFDSWNQSRLDENKKTKSDRFDRDMARRQHIIDCGGKPGAA